MTNPEIEMHDIDHGLTVEVLKRVQQRLRRAEQRIEIVEAELLTFRELQISVLQDLHRIYRLIGRQEERLAPGAAVPAAPAAIVRHEDDRKR